MSCVENQLQSRAQETEVIGLATATLVSKYRKMATFDEFLARFFVIGKAAVAVLLFFVGIPHMVWYLILWTGMVPVHPVTLWKAFAICGIGQYLFVVLSMGERSLRRMYDPFLPPNGAVL